VKDNNVASALHFASLKTHSDRFLAWLVMPPAALCLLSLIWPVSIFSGLSILCGFVFLVLFFVSLLRFKDAFFIHANLFFLVFFFFFPAIFLTDVVFWGGAATYGFKGSGPITIACTWLTFSNLGYYISSKRTIPFRETSLVKFYGEAFDQAVWFNIALLIALAIYFAAMSSVFLMDRYQGQLLFVSNITARSRDSLFVVFLPRCLAFASLLAALLAFLKQSSRLRLIVLIAAFAIWLAYNNPLSTAREVLLSQGFMIALILGLPQNRPLLFWSGMILVLFIVGPTVSFFSREYAYSQSIAFFKGADFDVYQNSVAFWRYMSVHGFSYGQVLLRDFSFWLPREFKPGLQDISAAVALGNGYLQPFISLPAFDEFFADFGYLGLIPLSFATGYFLGFSENYSLSPRDAIHVPGRLALLYFIASILAILRGPLIGILPFIALGSASVFALSLLCCSSSHIRHRVGRA
jgi:hypothetical protein